MVDHPHKPDDELRRRVENHLNRLGCGLRAANTIFEVYNLDSGVVIVTFADLEFFARTNDIIKPSDDAPKGP